MSLQGAAEDVTRSEPSLDELVSLRAIVEPRVSDDGRLIACVVHDPAPRRGDSPRSDIWLSCDGAAARPITSGSGVDSVPRISPTGRQLAFASDRLRAGVQRLYVLELDESGAAAGDARLVDSLIGSVEDIIWSRDGSRIVARVADEGSDTGNAGGGVRIALDGEDEADVLVRGPAVAWRRICTVDVTSGETVQVTSDGVTVWDIGWAGDGPVAAVLSADPSESGWYDAHVAMVDLETSSIERVYASEWQLQCPAVSRDGRFLAILEAPQSDRALLSGAVTVIDLTTGDIARPSHEADVNGLKWMSDGRLFWVGVASLETACGFATSRTQGGRQVWDLDVRWRALATLGGLYTVAADCSLDGRVVAGPREAHNEPSELMSLELVEPTARWQALTDANAHLAGRPGPHMQTHTWVADDGLEIQGMLLLPRTARPEGALPLVVVVHGGPTNASTPLYAAGAHGGDALLLTQAGFAVLVPNVRGSTGRGRDFMAANIGDIGGGDLRDLESGVASLVGIGLVDPMRVGIVGLSYGGFMAAWAAVRSTVFAASVPISGVMDWLSFHHTSNLGRFDEIYLAGDPYDVAGPFLERSPVMYVRGCDTPTLLLHGDMDLACPISQAQEFYQGLVYAGCEAELVTYKGAGHGMTERGHVADVLERIVGWFTTHLRPVDGSAT